MIATNYDSTITNQFTTLSTTIPSSSDSMNTSNNLIIFVVGIVMTFVICIIGTFGNLICIIVLIKITVQSVAKCPLFIILISLSFSDSAVLVLNFWTNILSIGLPYTGFTATLPLYLNHGYIIRIFWPILLIAQMSSIYLTVLVSYERWLAVVKPFHASQRAFSLKRTTMLILVMIVLSTIYNIPRGFEYIPENDSIVGIVKFLPKTYYCNDVKYNLTELDRDASLVSSLLMEYCNLTVVSYNKSQMANSLLYRYGYCATLYFVIMFLIPVSLITYTNLALVKCVKSSKRQWGNMTGNQRKEVRLSYVPLAIVCMFYIFSLPAVVINFIDSLNVVPASPDNPSFNTWQAALIVSNFFVLLNSAINFLIYCFLGKKFRSTLFNLCSCKKSSQRNGFIRSALQYGMPINNTSATTNHTTIDNDSTRSPFCRNNRRQESLIL